MCGIIGLANFNGINQQDLAYFKQVLLKSIIRGHDATGVGTQDLKIWKNGVPVTQFIQSAQYKEFEKHAIGKKWIIGHTRHGTQGNPKNNINNHPLRVYQNSAIFVHNGIVYSQKIGSDKSKTDTYIIAKALEQKWGNKPLQQIVKDAYSLFYGYAATMVISKNAMVCTAVSNPVNKGVLPNKSLIFASQESFFPKGTTDIYSFRSGESIRYDTNGNSKKVEVEMADAPRKVYNWDRVDDDNFETEDDQDTTQSTLDFNYDESPFWLGSYKTKSKKKKPVKVNSYARRSYYRGRF